MSNSTALVSLSSKFASKYGVGDGKEVSETLKATCFKGANVTDAQMVSLLIVSDQYGLNPFTREIFAFPDKGGIVPVVGVDGWSRIINEHPMFDGLEFVQNDESCTCVMYRKDRAHAIKVTEWLSECKRDNATPWKTHPKRMLRHKALIQCARLAFGFVGIYDQDEAERIIEGEVINKTTGEFTKKQLPPYLDDKIKENLAAWQSSIDDDKTTAQRIVSMLSSKFDLTDAQMAIILSLKKQEQQTEEIIDAVVEETAGADTSNGGW